jgi:hypothetical protein
MKIIFFYFLKNYFLYQHYIIILKKLISSKKKLKIRGFNSKNKHLLLYRAKLIFSVLGWTVVLLNTLWESPGSCALALGLASVVFNKAWYYGLGCLWICYDFQTVRVYEKTDMGISSCLLAVMSCGDLESSCLCGNVVFLRYFLF